MNEKAREISFNTFESHVLSRQTKEKNHSGDYNIFS